LRSREECIRRLAQRGDDRHHTPALAKRAVDLVYGAWKVLGTLQHRASELQHDD
jgi:hypothetical protein